MAEDTNIKVLANNRKAFHEFFIEDRYEAGIALSGTEVKSMRMGNLNLKDSYAAIHGREMFIYNMHISPYEKGNIFNRDPLRPRKLLLHKREILKLTQATQAQGYALIPLQVYLSHGLVKVEIALAKGKKLYDKRHSEAERDAKRDMDRAKRDSDKGM